ncbi:MAG: heavy metal translocating P-type ATPase metal-binding domain-containing protein, partial [Gammaproteobacteria bacterium]|nr:heavy metal translocating P-type ATPase metal-binding domain-containing protein [Gammaproteobacteria bacterium]
MERCFHCNEPVPPGTNYSLEANGERRQFCCPGCRAVAELISSQGLARFYDFRSAPALRATERERADDPWAVCDRPEVERRLTRSVGAGRKELRYRVDGVNCAACAWLIDRGLSVCDGVEDVSVDPVSREVLVSFDPERVRVSQILDATERYGFVPRLGSGT